MRILRVITVVSAAASAGLGVWKLYKTWSATQSAPATQ